MSKLLFINPKGIHDECEDMYNDDNESRQDRNTLKTYFGGKPPFTDEELEDLNLRANTNFLTGHQVQADATDQLNSVWTTQKNTFKIKLKVVDREQIPFKTRWEAGYTRAFNKILKKSKRIDSHIKSVCGDAATFGIAGLVKKNRQNWWYEHMDQDNILVPKGTELDLEKLTHFCLDTSITISELLRIVKAFGEEEDSGYNISNIKRIIDHCFTKEGRNKDVKNRMLDAAYDYDDFEWDRLRRTNGYIDKTLRTKVKVYMFFQKDQESGKIAKTIILRSPTKYNPEKKGPQSGEKDAYDYSVLYDKEEDYESMEEVWIPFNMQTNIAGTVLWEEVIGLGHLNYAIDMALERILNRTVESYDDSMKQIYTVQEGSDVEELENLLIKHNELLPEGVLLAENRIVPRWQESFSLINYFTQLQEKHGEGNYYNTGDKATDKLEVQFQAEQQSRAKRITQRVGSFNSRLEILGMQLLKSILESDLEEYGSYDIHEELKKELDREEVPWEIANDIDNVEISVSRIPGDGNDQLQGRLYSHFASNWDKFKPEVQPKILNLMTLIVSNDPDLADELSPVDEWSQPKSQQREALEENNISITQGIKPPIDVSDVDVIHIPIHLQGIQFVTQKIQMAGAMTQFDVIAVQELGAHIKQHIDRLAPSNPKQAKLFVNELMNLSSQFERVMKEYPPQNPKDPEQQMKQQEASLKERELAVREGELQRKFQKDQADNQKWSITQQHRELMGNFQNQIQAGNLQISQARLQLDELKAQIDAVDKAMSDNKQGENENPD